MINNLAGMTLVNPLSLSCNPYSDDQCDTDPPLESGSVCAAEIIASGDTCPDDYLYRLHTLASKEEAEADGFIVTHEGACGVCSSLQDLSVYMASPDLSDSGIKCAFRALANITDGVECYKELGFSDACAAIWLYNTQYTSSMCLTPCLQHASSGLPNNGPAPGCELVECMQCDEDVSGPLFKKFAARTRRASGLLSQIVRPCNAVPKVIHVDPCTLFTDSPTKSPTSDGSTRASAVLLGILVFLSAVAV